MPARRRSNPPPDLCLHIITFGISRGQPQISMPVILHADLSSASVPPRHLLNRYTGADPAIASSFFSMPGHERNYQSFLASLEDWLYARLADRQAGPGACVAVLVNCTAGMHRSVAVAERLARDVEGCGRWAGVLVMVEHLDTDVDRGVRRARRARAGDHDQRTYDGWLGRNRLGRSARR